MILGVLLIQPRFDVTLVHFHLTSSCSGSFLTANMQYIKEHGFTVVRCC
nr:MAG TPA: hypothetical protein [Caudoviricetes sp.]